MADPQVALDDALEEVVQAARAHLSAVRSAGGALDDEEVWRRYVALNNASHAYDQLLLDEFGEVTPWETEPIDVDDAEALLTDASVGELAGDPYPSVISVRQRRDYRVPSVSALLRAAEVSSRRVSAGGDDSEPPATVAEAVLELVQDGDGALGTLDVPELEPLEGVVAVAEVAEPLSSNTSNEDDAAAGPDPFALGPDDRVVGRLDEHPYLDVEPPDSDQDR